MITGGIGEVATLGSLVSAFSTLPPMITKGEVFCFGDVSVHLASPGFDPAGTMALGSTHYTMASMNMIYKLDGMQRDSVTKLLQTAAEDVQLADNAIPRVAFWAEKMSEYKVVDVLAQGIAYFLADRTNRGKETLGLFDDDRAIQLNGMEIFCILREDSARQLLQGTLKTLEDSQNLRKKWHTVGIDRKDIHLFQPAEGDEHQINVNWGVASGGLICLSTYKKPDPTQEHRTVLPLKVFIDDQEFKVTHVVSEYGIYYDSAQFKIYDRITKDSFRLRVDCPRYNDKPGTTYYATVHSDGSVTDERTEQTSTTRRSPSLPQGQS